VHNHHLADEPRMPKSENAFSVAPCFQVILCIHTGNIVYTYKNSSLHGCDLACCSTSAMHVFELKCIRQYWPQTNWWAIIAQFFYWLSRVRQDRNYLGLLNVRQVTLCRVHLTQRSGLGTRWTLAFRNLFIDWLRIRKQLETFMFTSSGYAELLIVNAFVLYSFTSIPPQRLKSHTVTVTVTVNRLGKL